MMEMDESECGWFVYVGGVLVEVRNGWLQYGDKEMTKAGAAGQLKQTEPLQFAYMNQQRELIQLSPHDTELVRRHCLREYTKQYNHLNPCPRPRPRPRPRARIRPRIRHRRQLQSETPSINNSMRKNRRNRESYLNSKLNCKAPASEEASRFFLRFPNDLQLEVDCKKINLIKKALLQDSSMKLNYTNGYGQLLKTLYALNPIVKIENNMTIQTLNDRCDFPNYEYTDIQKELSQSEFARALGLRHVSKNGEIQSPPDQVNLKEKSPPKKKEINGKWIKRISPENSTPNKNKLNRSIKRKSYLSQKKEYQPEEDRKILDWLLKGNNSVKVNGNEIWKNLEADKVMPGRTWQSLRSRYVKTILYKLRDYGLTSSEEMKLTVGAERGIMKQNKTGGKKANGVIANKENTVKLDIRQEDHLPMKRITRTTDPYSPENLDNDLNKRLRLKVSIKSKPNRDSSENMEKKTVKNRRKLFTEKEFLPSLNS